jgi:hypothetical protein
VPPQHSTGKQSAWHVGLEGQTQAGASSSGVPGMSPRVFEWGSEESEQVRVTDRPGLWQRAPYSCAHALPAPVPAARRSLRLGSPPRRIIRRGFARPPQRVLVCGWGDTPFMVEVLRTLDRGACCLPPGSEVRLFNPRPGAEVGGANFLDRQTRRRTDRHAEDGGRWAGQAGG